MGGHQKVFQMLVQTAAAEQKQRDLGNYLHQQQQLHEQQQQLQKQLKQLTKMQQKLPFAKAPAAAPAKSVTASSLGSASAAKGATSKKSASDQPEEKRALLSEDTGFQTPDEDEPRQKAGG